MEDLDRNALAQVAERLPPYLLRLVLCHSPTWISPSIVVFRHKSEEITLQELPGRPAPHLDAEIQPSLSQAPSSNIRSCLFLSSSQMDDIREILRRLYGNHSVSRHLSELDRILQAEPSSSASIFQEGFLSPPQIESQK